MQVLARNLAGSAGNGDRLPYRHALSRLHSDRRQMTVNTFYCTVLNSDIATQRAVLCYLDDLSWKDAVNSILVCCKVYPLVKMAHARKGMLSITNDRKSTRLNSSH